MKSCASSLERERARLAGAADDAARRAGEADEVLALAAGGAAGELRREAGGQQQLEAEGERVGAARAVGVAVEQRELVGQQVVDAGVRVAVVEDAGDGLAGARGAVERAAVLAQPRVARRSSRPRSPSAGRCGPRRARGRGGRTAPAARRSATCALRTPLAIALTRPRVGVYRCRIRSASP